MSLSIPFPFGWLLYKKAARVEVNISLAFLHWVGIALHPWPFISDIAIFVLKGYVKLQLTVAFWNCWTVVFIGVCDESSWIVTVCTYVDSMPVILMQPYTGLMRRSLWTWLTDTSTQSVPSTCCELAGLLMLSWCVPNSRGSVSETSDRQMVCCAWTWGPI